MDGQERWYAENIPLRDQVIADVGANVGRLSQFFWEASGGTSRVVSIEPLHENVALIRERIRAAGAQNWTVEACAASGRKGKVALSVQRTAEGVWNSVVQRGAARRVPCRPLSQIVPDATVVKLDIEGHEYGVLEEALPRLNAVHTWAVELHMVEDRPLQFALGAFMAHGYELLAATQPQAGAPEAWGSAEILATLDWASIPGARLRPGGGEFKMLHLLARRTA